MAIFTTKEYLNRYTAGQTAVDNSNWRLAYDCFFDCKQYLERYEPWNIDDIDKLESLIELCNQHF